MGKKLSVEQKMARILSQPAVDEIARADAEKLKSIVSVAALNIEAIEEQKKADVNVKEAQAHLRDLTGSYSDALKAEKAKIIFCRLRLQEMGKL